MRGPRKPASPGDEELVDRVKKLRELQRPCRLCPRRCGAMRGTTRLGYCGQPDTIQVASVCPHGGEEPPLCGTGGAGTVFLAGCTMRCCFCQNHQISQPPRMDPSWASSPVALALRFLALQEEGCHNIEWVSPTQHLPQLVEALRIARNRGLHLPVVFNCNGYQRLEVLRLLEGVVDLYLPDMKYSSHQLAARLSDTGDYVQVNQQAILEMWRQVGPLDVDPDSGLARRGLLIRHLVLPGLLANTDGVLGWIGRTLGSSAWLSLMAQFYPIHDAHRAGLSRHLTRREYRRAIDALTAAGLWNGWIQELDSASTYRPDFSRGDPFDTSTRGVL